MTANMDTSSSSELYQEELRPQFHFTAKKGWINDPVGLVYYGGEYHLGFDHNPHDRTWGPSYWGHAVSTDLVHWEQLDNSIEPDPSGWIWSGSAVVDWHNTGGFQTGSEPALVACFSRSNWAGDDEVPNWQWELNTHRCEQCLAYSNDRGRTWTKYADNPVLPHIVKNNRDPKLVWHAPTERWVMALYLDRCSFGLFTSPDLKQWTGESIVHMQECRECPDLFELPVDGDPENTRWVFTGAGGRYQLGSFDGKFFTAEAVNLVGSSGPEFYAAQSWSDVPDRRIQIAWMVMGKYPGMPFNQQLSFPCELTLRTTPLGVRLCREPVKEIETLHRQTHSWDDETLGPGKNLLDGICGELFDIRVEIDLGSAALLLFDVRGKKINYKVEARELSAADRTACLEPIDNRIKLQILVDRTSVEIFAIDCGITISACFLPHPADTTLGFRVRGGECKVVSLKVHELCSAWQ